jgi:hypothetical protein
MGGEDGGAKAQDQGRVRAVYGIHHQSSPNDVSDVKKNIASVPTV